MFVSTFAKSTLNPSIALSPSAPRKSVIQMRHKDMQQTYSQSSVEQVKDPLHAVITSNIQVAYNIEHKSSNLWGIVLYEIVEIPARRCAFLWSSPSRPTISKAIKPAAANTPTCLMPPPRAFLSLLAWHTKSLRDLALRVTAHG